MSLPTELGGEEDPGGAITFSTVPGFQACSSLQGTQLSLDCRTCGNPGWQVPEKTLSSDL